MKARKRTIAALALFINVALFLSTLVFYSCVFATNDDYRMNLIVSGAYIGTPSAQLVFMKYPIAWVLSKLYAFTTQIPWYGIFSLLCLFVPSCIIAFYIFKETEKKGHIVLGFFLYIVFYFLLVQKHVLLLQFTATASFMAAAWVLMLWYLPDKKYGWSLFWASLFGAISFCIRMKVFAMFVPVALLLVCIRLLQNKRFDAVLFRRYCIGACMLLVALAGSFVSDKLHTDAAYAQFNSSRSQVYDFGSIPPYESNKAFYDAHNIDETTYYNLSARYLDLDENVTKSTLSDVASYIKEQKNTENAGIKLLHCFFNSPANFFESEVVFETIFTLLILAAAVFGAYQNKRQALLLAPLSTLAIVFFEMTYLCFVSRVIERLTDVLLLILALVSLVSFLAVIKKQEEGKRTQEKSHRRLFKAGSFFSLAVVASCLIVANQVALTERSEQQNTINSRLEVLNAYAKEHPENFYYYDSYDFIAASSPILSVYDGMLNTDSLGNWYIKSSDNLKRNSSFGIKNSAEGLIKGEKNMYFAAIGNLKRGIVLTMKEQYNMEPVALETIPYDNNVITIYTFVPCS